MEPLHVVLVVYLICISRERPLLKPEFTCVVRQRPLVTVVLITAAEEEVR